MCAKKRFLTVLLGTLITAAVSQAGGIGYVFTGADVAVPGTIGDPFAQKYTYYVNGLTLLANQELDIVFDPSRYGTLINGIAGPQFDLLLLQPNNPEGAAGHYSALALVNDPSFSGEFSVDFLSSDGADPGPQPYFINQYDANGAFLGAVQSGFTFDATATPEPSCFVLCGLILAAACIRRAAQHSSAARA
jgi:hypothetical protein